MRILIATVAASLLTAAAAAGVVLRSTSTHPATASAGAPATDAVPGLVYRSGTVALRLTDGPCPYEDVRTQLETEGIVPARAYVVEQAKAKRRTTTGCWSRDVGGDVVTLEPGRELGQIPISWFRSERGA